jgi:predicted AAA+ superfamily ATPase
MSGKKDLSRPQYVSQLTDLKDKDIIKVITGVRHSGKSTILRMFAERLKTQKVKDEQIVFLDLESADLWDVNDHLSLYRCVKDRMCKKGKTYLFLDEVQTVKDHEKAVKTIRNETGADIYISGSGGVLSKEFMTLLSGKYAEIPVYPFSFQEYVKGYAGERPPEDLFRDYLEGSGFPVLARERDERVLSACLGGIRDSIILRDIITRSRNKSLSLTEKLLYQVFANVGSLVSPASLAKDIKKNERDVTNESVERHLDTLCGANILIKVPRYDIKSRKYIPPLCKYYAADLGLRSHTLGYGRNDTVNDLENLVCLELLRRGYRVETGRIDDAAIDLIARADDRVRYYQIVRAAGTEADAKCKVLTAVPGDPERFLITADRGPAGQVNGIRRICAFDLLSGKDI